MGQAWNVMFALALGAGANLVAVATAQSHGSHATNTEYPFGQVAVSSKGDLYYVDRESGRVDEVTPNGTRTVLRTLNDRGAPSGPVPGLSGLSVAKRAMWFTAGDALYRASLSGKGPRKVGPAPGAVDLDVLSDGTAYFTTTSGVFEARDGRTTRVAGGGALGFAQQQVGAHLATKEDIAPTGVAGTGPHSFYFTNENRLYLVRSGMATVEAARFDFFNGELAVSSSGAVYGICDWHMCRVSGQDISQLFTLPEPVSGAFAAPDALAVSPSGDFYISYSDQSLPPKAGIEMVSSAGKLLAVVASRGT